MEIRWLGTAAVEVTCQKTRLLIDPYFQKTWRTKKRQNTALRQAISRADAIVVTHPHLDHFADIAQIVRMTGAPVYVAPNGRTLAQKHGADTATLRDLGDGMTIPVGDALTVRVWRARHVRFDKPLVSKTLKRAFQPHHFPRGIQIGMLNKRFAITDDDVFAFEIMGDGKRVLALGSANLREDVDYPTDADALLFPYQGRSDLATYSAPLVERLKPRRIVLTHFDDAFPPISERVDTRPFLNAHPNAEEPVFNESITL